jgi:hypothetical protein
VIAHPIIQSGVKLLLLVMLMMMLMMVVMMMMLLGADHIAAFISTHGVVVRFGMICRRCDMAVGGAAAAAAAATTSSSCSWI